MLKELRIKNFNSFKEEIVFTMEPDTSVVSEHPTHLINNIHGDKLLKVASIYGPNAGGKTTLIKALYLLTHIFNEMNEQTYIKIGNQSLKMLVEPFRMVSNQDDVLTSTVIFLDDLYEFGYSYGLQFIQDTSVYKYKVIEESLSYRKLGTDEDISIFERKGNNIESPNLNRELGISKIVVSDTQLLIKHIWNNYINKYSKNHLLRDVLYRLSSQIQNIICYDNFNFATEKVRIENIINNPNNKMFIIRALNDLGINIHDIYFDEFSSQKSILVVHKVDNKDFELSWENESQGTKQLILMLLSVYTRINLGGILLIDELNAHLHPKLVQKVIELFTGNHNNKAQLIFNSHDIWNMNYDLFRRDEIWFVYRNDKLSSELVCLSDFIDYKGDRVRKDAKYSKQYMEGRYGADPFIKKGANWFGKNQ